MARMPKKAVLAGAILSLFGIFAGGLRGASCANCTSELAAVLAAQAIVDAAQQVVDEAFEDYITCTMNCDDELNTYLAAQVTLDAAQSTLDEADMEYQLCISAPAPPPGEVSVLVSRGDAQ